MLGLQYFTDLKSCSRPENPENVTKEEKEAIKNWEYDDSVASYLLSQKLIDMIAIRNTEMQSPANTRLKACMHNPISI